MQDHLNREQIARYCNRQSAPEELGLLDEHLAECADCRELLSSAARLREALQRGPAATASQQTTREHLSYEQLEAFVDEKSSSAEMHLLGLHVRECRRCADELEDLRTFKSELSQAASRGAKSKKVWWAIHLASIFAARPIFATALTAGVILLVAMGIYTLRSPHPTDTTQTANSMGVGSRTVAGTLTAEEEKRVLQAWDQLETTVPTSLSEVHRTRQTLLGKSNLVPTLEVVEPVGEVAWEVRPLFHWKPMSRAINYSVAIFDANLNPVEESEKLQGVQWEPGRDLIRGRLYQWQVTAHLEDGSSLSAPAPPQPEARFRVLDRDKEEELSRFLSAHPDAHFALGILDAQAGLLSKAEQQFRQVSQTDADYQAAQRLLKRIQEIRTSAN